MFLLHTTPTTLNLQKNMYDTWMIQSCGTGLHSTHRLPTIPNCLPYLLDSRICAGNELHPPLTSLFDKKQDALLQRMTTTMLSFSTFHQEIKRESNWFNSLPMFPGPLLFPWVMTNILPSWIRLLLQRDESFTNDIFKTFLVFSLPFHLVAMDWTVIVLGKCLPLESFPLSSDPTWIHSL